MCVREWVEGVRCAFEIWSLVPQINNALKSPASGYRQRFECVCECVCVGGDAAASSASVAASGQGSVLFGSSVFCSAS